MPQTVKKGKKGTTLDSKEKSAEIATYYGFDFVEAPLVTKEDIQKTRKELEIDVAKQHDDEKHITVYAEEKVSLLRNYLEKEMHTKPQPIMLYYEGHPLREGETKKKDSYTTFHMDILGTTKSIGEATLIKTSLEILKEEGYKNVSVNINSIGDKDSVARFCRELSNYYKKHLDTLSASCRQSFKRDPFELYDHKDEKCKALKEHAPNPISYLSEPSRVHFKEVLEYLETLDIPYNIHHALVCNRKMWSQTAFELRETDTNNLLAVGIRYNQVAKKIGHKKELGAVGITVSFKKKPGAKKGSLKTKKPQVYFIQLGFDAKLKSLNVIEMLRQGKIAMSQSLGRDKIGGQIQSAENTKVPYTIIMGQKEARENTVIFRDMATRSQEIIPLSHLPEYLKKIK